MASINQYPPPASTPPPVPPPYRYRRSITGPVILIAIGVIFLLSNLGIIQRWQLWHWFGHWWPVLLILWGVIALVEHASAQRMGYRTRHLGGAGIFLLIVLVALGVSAHYSSDVNWGGVRDQLQMDDDMGGFFGTAFTYDETLQQSFPKDGNLRIVCDRGSLNITPADDDQLRVVIHKKLYGHDQNEANKYNEGTKPQISVTGSAVLLNANTNGAGDHGVTTDMEISVPAGAALDIASKRGDVTVNSRKANVKASVQHGDISLTEISGPVLVNLEKGSLRATQINGDVNVTGHVDSVNIEDVSGTVSLNGDFYDDVRLSKIAKSVVFKTSRSDMEFASLAGDLDIASDEVRGSELAGPSRVSSSSKDIHLEDVSGDLQVQSNNGDVEITTSGKQPAGKLEVATTHGDVAVTMAGKTTPDKVNVATEHGDITLTIPTGAGFQLSAVTRKGDVSSEFDAIKVDENNGTTKASGSVGSGNSKLQVATDTGDIKIAKS
jgi:DUF4097 and DUF4098 domain-containing protein YvlB